MKRVSLVAGVLSSVFCTQPVLAQPPARTVVGASASLAICKSIDGAIDAAEKEASMQVAENLTEDSAPRAGVEAAKMNAAYLSIQANLILMEQHHCAPHDHAIGDNYLVDALKCKTDLLTASISRASDVPESCDRKKWIRVN